ncbi:MAG: DUF494 domain-containing protein [Methylococcales bacterium]|nr:DUF494 domain-containing protein [Methylococcales bacterium]
MFDVLIYIFENYLEDNVDLFPNSHAIRDELLQAGFALPNVNLAFAWLESLNENDKRECETQAFRIFSESEKRHLDLDCRNLLIFLEHTGILSPDHRETVIDRALVLENEVIYLDELKWIVLMILLTQSDDEVAYSRMEDIVYDLSPAYLH